MKFYWIIGLVLFTLKVQAQFNLQEPHPTHKEMESLLFPAIRLDGAEILSKPGSRLKRSRITTDAHYDTAKKTHSRDARSGMCFFNVSGQIDTCITWYGEWQTGTQQFLRVFYYDASAYWLKVHSIHPVRLTALLPHPVTHSPATEQQSVWHWRSIVFWENGRPAIIRQYTAEKRDTVLTSSEYFFTIGKNRLTKSTVMESKDAFDSTVTSATYDGDGRIINWVRKSCSDPLTRHMSFIDSFTVAYGKRKHRRQHYSYESENSSGGLTVIPTTREWYAVDNQGRQVYYQREYPLAHSRYSAYAISKKTSTHYQASDRSISKITHDYSHKGDAGPPFTQYYRFDEVGRMISQESHEGVWWEKWE